LIREGFAHEYRAMDKMIYPRSPREVMSGWVHLPRFIDKIRLHLAGKLHPDYAANFTQGFDGRWLEAAGLKADEFIEVVRNTVTDGEVADWVRLNVKKSDADKKAFADLVLNRGNDTEENRARLEQRKAHAGLANRADIKTFADLIEFDEKRA
jgi:hypothetical protein